MNHFGYVGGAYAVFVVVLLWDFVAPRVKLAQVRRAIAQRQRREATRNAKDSTTP